MTDEQRNWIPTPVPGLVVHQLDAELLIFNGGKNHAHCLNPSMSSVWKLCNGRNSVQDIVDNLTKEPPGNLKADTLELAFKELIGKGLLKNDIPSTSEWKRLSRRDLVRRIGSGALIAMPVIASIAIPTAAEAASCFSLGHLCSSNSQCCSGHCGIAGINLACI